MASLEPFNSIRIVIESLSKGDAGRVNFAKVDTDANQGLAVRYNILSIPTVMIFKGGWVVHKIIGAMPAQAYRQRIGAALEAN